MTLSVTKSSTSSLQTPSWTLCKTHQHPICYHIFNHQIDSRTYDLFGSRSPWYQNTVTGESDLSRQNRQDKQSRFLHKRTRRQKESQCFIYYARYADTYQYNCLGLHHSHIEKIYISIVLYKIRNRALRPEHLILFPKGTLMQTLLISAFFVFRGLPLLVWRHFAPYRYILFSLALELLFPTAFSRKSHHGLRPDIFLLG